MVSVFIEWRGANSSKKNNILLGFIDEGAITVHEGRKYGRSYIGITPLANVPLIRIKCSIIALVLPGFGVLFEFINDAVNNLEYCKFLIEAVRFMRRYICNNKAEIVIIEDNCPIHSTPKVEETNRNSQDKKILFLETIIFPVFHKLISFQ